VTDTTLRVVVELQLGDVTQRETVRLARGSDDRPKVGCNVWRQYYWVLDCEAGRHTLDLLHQLYAPRSRAQGKTHLGELAAVEVDAIPRNHLMGVFDVWNYGGSPGNAYTDALRFQTNAIAVASHKFKKTWQNGGDTMRVVGMSVEILGEVKRVTE
jgi:hypothetical protein